MIVSIVRFSSALPEAEVLASFAARAERYRSVPGLVEKLYLRFPYRVDQAPSAELAGASG